MSNNTRLQKIETRLREVFAPLELVIHDDSHLHAGHAGAREGKGHFRIYIVATAFANRTPIQRHRLVYSALGELMQSDIHALSIDALAPKA